MNTLPGRNTGRGREFQASVREYSWKGDCELEARTSAVLEQRLSRGPLPTGTEQGSSHSVPDHIFWNEVFVLMRKLQPRELRGQKYPPRFLCPVRTNQHV